jgi:hypothetical protein
MTIQLDYVRITPFPKVWGFDFQLPDGAVILCLGVGCLWVLVSRLVAGSTLIVDVSKAPVRSA